MPKLQKFKKDNKKITTKNIIVSLSIIMCLLIVVVITKSYAIYKMQKEFDVIKNQIGNYSMGDVRVAVLVDGKETDTFPSYETNYKVESIECSNGVTATFDTINWQINIADMSATSTKCTVSFNSKETNETTPVSYTKEELIALNEEIKNTSAKELADYLYPVGSIYMSTEDDTIEKVQDKFGGTWVKYSSGTTLVGDDGTNYITNDETKGSGGSSSVTLNKENMPSHTHDVTAAGSVSSSFTGSSSTTSSNGGHTHTGSGNTSTTGNHNHTGSGTTSTTGNHNHTAVINYKLTGDTNPEGINGETIYGGGSSIYRGNAYPYNAIPTVTTSTTGNHNHTYSFTTSTTGNHYHTYSFTTSSNGGHTHTVTASGSVKSTFTGSKVTSTSTGSGSSFSIQNPYTVVYMYKRTA